jgi:hypothetical protein
MNRALSGLYLDHRSRGLCRHSPGLYSSSTGYIIPRIILGLRGRAALHPRCNPAVFGYTFPVHPGDIKYFIPSGVECRMFPDHPGR